MNSIIHEGIPFKVEIFTDEHAPPPWEMSDGHGPVRALLSRNPAVPKKPGERVLDTYSTGKPHLVYDWQAAMLLALRDGWRPSKRLDGVQTRRTLAAAAVQEDFDHLRAWCRDEWHYVGVCVTHVVSGAHMSLWGIESNATEYHTEVAHELAADVMESVAYKMWHQRIADCEQALNVADRLQRVADAQDIDIDQLLDLTRKGAELLRALARKGE